MTHFSDLGLAEPILRAVTEAGYDTPTPIQTQAIPQLLKGHDLLGIAQTGTGKTAAFALPILDKLLKAGKQTAARGCQVLILAPTRELAIQIADNFKIYAKYSRASVTVVIGGVKPAPQVRAMARGVDVLVATPGRLLDHVGAGAIKLDQVHTVVLDEADHMLDLGFLVPIRRILKMLPKVRQNLFFSATMPGPIGTLAGEMLSKPVTVQVTPVATTAEKVEQHVFLVEHPRKRDLLLELVSKPEFSRTLVFSRTKRGADRIAKFLEQAKVSAAAIHGNKSQSQRERALDGFKAGEVRVLVATDIAARGIDVDKVSHVVNFDLPEVAEAYVHRIGRTARAGEVGTAYAFCSDEEQKLLREIEKTTRQKLPVTDRRNEGGSAYVAGDMNDVPLPPAMKESRGGRNAAPRGDRNGRGGRNERTERPARAARTVSAEHPARSERGKPAPREGQSYKDLRRQADMASDNPNAGLDRMLGNKGRVQEPVAEKAGRFDAPRKAPAKAPAKTSANATGGVVTGTVKWFNPKKGFGFIQPDHGGEDIFLHISAVESAGMHPPADGAKIAFEVATDPRRGKPEAANIKAA